MPTHYSGTPTEILALDTFIKLTRATNSLSNRLAAAETMGGLTESQFGILETLHHLGPLCQKQIGQKLLKSGGNITLVVDNLEKAGLVIRSTDPDDRRTTIVTLTLLGEERISRIFPEHLRTIVSELSSLSPEEQEHLGRLCKKLGMGTGHIG